MIKLFKQDNGQPVEYADLIVFCNKLKWQNKLYVYIDTVVVGFVFFVMFCHLDYPWFIEYKTIKYINNYTRDLYNLAVVNDWETIKYLCVRIIALVNGSDFI